MCIRDSFFTVETGEGLVICRLRGKLKQGRAVGDIAALGDNCLLYTSDAADERSSVDLGGRRIIKKKKRVK